MLRLLEEKSFSEDVPIKSKNNLCGLKNSLNRRTMMMTMVMTVLGVQEWENINN